MPLLGILKLTITPPADAPIGEYSLSVTHRDEEKSLPPLVLLFNPWCPGGWTANTRQTLRNKAEQSKLVISTITSLF